MIANTCLIGGSVGLVGELAGDEGVVLVVDVVVGVAATARLCCGEASLSGAAAVIVVVSGEFADSLDPELDGASPALADLTTTSSGPAGLPAALLTSEPTRMPNDSSAITATAATRGEESERPRGTVARRPAPARRPPGLRLRRAAARLGD